MFTNSKHALASPKIVDTQSNEHCILQLPKRGYHCKVPFERKKKKKKFQLNASGQFHFILLFILQTFFLKKFLI
jgi:hypothetical protein